MTVKGFIRSYGAVVRRAEREQQRRAREAAKFYKQQRKEQEIANATEAAKRYDEYISVLKSIHKDSSSSIDWKQVLNERPPQKPQPIFHRELAAKQALNNYRPGFLAKVFGFDKRHREKLTNQIQSAVEKDKKENQSKQEEYDNSYKNWIHLQAIAKGVINHSASAYEEAMHAINPLGEIDELGSKVDMQFFADHVVVNFLVRSSEVVPDYVLTQTSTGKLSRKTMPASKFQELYQDYVCSATLRISREIFACLPVNLVIVNAKADLLNSSTGQIEVQPILSVAIPASTLERLNFETIDPSDSMTNFIHHMKFSKSSGFTPVELVNPASIKFDTTSYVGRKQ